MAGIPFLPPRRVLLEGRVTGPDALQINLADSWPVFCDYRHNRYFTHVIEPQKTGSEEQICKWTVGKWVIWEAGFHLPIYQIIHLPILLCVLRSKVLCGSLSPSSA